MTVWEFEELLARLAKGWSARDYDAVAENFAENLYYSDPLNYVFRDRQSLRTMADVRSAACFGTPCSTRTNRSGPRSTLTKGHFATTGRFGSKCLRERSQAGGSTSTETTGIGKSFGKDERHRD